MKIDSKTIFVSLALALALALALTAILGAFMLGTNQFKHLIMSAAPSPSVVYAQSGMGVGLNFGPIVPSVDNCYVDSNGKPGMPNASVLCTVQTGTSYVVNVSNNQSPYAPLIPPAAVVVTSWNGKHGSVTYSPTAVNGCTGGTITGTSVTKNGTTTITLTAGNLANCKIQ